MSTKIFIAFLYYVAFFVVKITRRKANVSAMKSIASNGQSDKTFLHRMSCLFDQLHNTTKRSSPAQNVIRISNSAFCKKASIHPFVLSI